MDCPFPGMDPWLEHPALWPEVHNRLIASMADDLAPRLAPAYTVRMERRVYRLTARELEIIGLPDLSVVTADRLAEAAAAYVVRPAPAPRVLDVTVPVRHEVSEHWLEVRAAGSREVVTVIELLSPANKVSGAGRADYLDKRARVLDSTAHLVEIDLLRAGAPMPLEGEVPPSDYRVLVSRGHQRPRAQLFVLDLPQRLPAVPVPIQPDEPEPALDLTALVHDLYRRARYDLELDYSRPPQPSLPDELAVWARARIEAARGGMPGREG